MDDRSCATFSDVLAARCAQTPQGRAFIFLADTSEASEAVEHPITYAELSARADSIAAALADRGLLGQRALMLFPPGLEFWTALFGCFRAGVVAVPAYPPRTSRLRATDRLRGILRDAAPAVVLMSRDSLTAVHELLYAMQAEGGEPLSAPPIVATDALDVPSPADARFPCLSRGDLALLQYTSGSTSSPKGVMLTHGNLLHNAQVICDAFGHTPAARGVFWQPPYHDMGLSGLLQAIYAGFPMAFMSPAAFLQQPLRWLRAISRLRATTSGGPNFAFDLCVSAIAPEDRKTLDLSSWDVAFNGAEPIDAATLDRFTEAFAPCGFRREAFFPCYGLAESTLMVSGGTKMRPLIFAAAEQGKRRVGCGTSRRGLEFIIVDPASRTQRAGGEIGEIWVSGPSVAKGYWNKPRESAETFEAKLADAFPSSPGTPGEDRGGGPAASAQMQDPLPTLPSSSLSLRAEGRSTRGGPECSPQLPAIAPERQQGHWLRTGDLGFVRGGELFVTGRLKDLIIIRGVNHYPQDIEATVAQAHPALRAAGGAAFSVEVDGAERLVVAQEIERARRGEDPNPIFAAIRQAIGRRHELEVDAIVLLRPGALPKTSSGKVQRFACRQAFIEGKLDAVAQWNAPAAQTPRAQSPADLAQLSSAAELEAFILRRLAGQIGGKGDSGTAQIDPAEPFANYGLDSAKAAELAAEIARRISRQVPLTLFWDFPTPAALAQHLFEPSVRAEALQSAL